MSEEFAPDHQVDCETFHWVSWKLDLLVPLNAKSRITEVTWTYPLCSWFCESVCNVRPATFWSFTSVHYKSAKQTTTMNLKKSKQKQIHFFCSVCTLMSMPRAEELLLKNLEGIFEDRSGSSRPKPRFNRISSGSSSYRSSSSDTLRRDTRTVREKVQN